MTKMLRAMLIMSMVFIAPSALSAGGQAEGADAGELAVPSGFNETGLPIVDDTMTLTVAVAPFAVQTKATESFEKVLWLEDQTNVHVEWDEIRGDEAAQRINLMFAAGDLPDVFLTNTLNDNQKLQFGGEGLLLELTELIEQYAPNINHMFDVIPASRAAATELDGAIYGVAGVNPWPPDFWANLAAWGINKAWLDNLGLDVPMTTDELYDVLVAFKTQDPNGNGEADELPVVTRMTEGLNTPEAWYLFAPFGVAFQKEGFMVRNDRVVSSYTVPEMKEALRFLHRLYDEELINQDLFTVQTNEMMSRMRQVDPVVVGTLGYWSMSNVLGVPRFRDTDEFVHLKVVQSQFENGVLPVAVDRHIRINEAFVTEAAEFPPVAMRWIDYLYDERVQMEIGQGPIDWLDDNTGSLAPVPDGMTGAEFRNNTVSPKSVWPNMYIYDEYELVPGDIYGVTERANYTRLHEGMFTEQNLPFTLALISADEGREIARLWVPLKEYLDRMAAEFIVSGGIDERWEEYVATAERMGLADVIAIRQREYERFKDSVGGDTSLRY